MVDFAPEVIFHLAAYNHVGGSFRHYSEALECNGNGTANLLNAYEHEYDRFVYISSSEVYGAQTVPFIETKTPQPVSPYAIGKIHWRALLQNDDGGIGSAHYGFTSPLMLLGPIKVHARGRCRDNHDLSEQCPGAATLGTQTREFNFVSNLEVDGMIQGATTDAAIGEIINIGAAEEITIRDLITTIRDATGSSSELQFGALPPRPTEIEDDVRQSARKDILGWTPELDFRSGLDTTIDWFRAFRDVYGDPRSPLNRLSPATR